MRIYCQYEGRVVCYVMPGSCFLHDSTLKWTFYVSRLYRLARTEGTIRNAYCV